jgi:hypothetical protein
VCSSQTFADCDQGSRCRGPGEVPWPFIHPVWMRDAVWGQTVRSTGQTGVHRTRWAGQTGLGITHMTCKGASGFQYAYIYALWAGTLSVSLITELDPQVTPHTLLLQLSLGSFFTCPLSQLLHSQCNAHMHVPASSLKPCDFTATCHTRVVRRTSPTKRVQRTTHSLL